MTPIAETRIPVQLDRDTKGAFIPRTLVFNVNTMSAYEEASGKFYWDTVLAIFDVYAKYGPKLGPNPILDKDGVPQPSDAEKRRSSTDILRNIRAKDIHLFIWAALHEYDGDEPRWPLTLAKVGRLIGTWDTISMLALIVKGIQNNSPTPEELGEVKAGPQLVEPPAEAAKTDSANGGEASIALDAAAFA